MRIATPTRALHTYTQHHGAPPDRAFPLLCPGREADCLERWGPLPVLTGTGVAEKDAVIVAAAYPVDAVWYLTEHDPAGGIVEMIKIAPQVTATRLTIRVRETATGGLEVTVSYTHTSLGPEGNAVITAFTAEAYEAFIRGWERRMAHYLEHGAMLRVAHA